jgi:N-acetylglucosaminyldiphosphoundecaprenol N-acetyl-beta-D-mannosaminyltransferase
MNAAADPCAPAAGASEAAVPPSVVDFDRPVVSILGLPFDAIGIDEAVQRIRDAAFEGRRCFVSTPNLNFAIVARADAAFRGSVLRSDLSLVDGMPLVWVARLLGLPVPERVSGSDVFDALQRHPGPPLKVFLFGGPPGAAARAAESIDRRGGGLRCVGFDAAGFDSIEAMSGPGQIERINRSGAHFVVVALGARKGQAWIEHNAGRLAAPVLAHLGAVINFAAGTVRRAPHWMQWAGLEWLWRIREEPALWRRYWSDGRVAVSLLATRVVPDAIDRRWSRRHADAPGALEVLPAPGRVTLRLRGAWSDGLEASLRTALTEWASRGDRVVVDLHGATMLGHAGVGLLLLAQGWFGARGGLEIVGVQGRLRAALRRQLVERVFVESQERR